MSPRPVTPVGLLAAALDAAVGQAEQEGVSAALLGRLRQAQALAGGLDPYVEANTSPASAALEALAERTAAEDWSGRGPLEEEMLSGHVEGQTLAFLVRLARAARVLDVGMFTGYSALAMAEALPADGRVVACELDPAVAALAQSCFDGSPAGARIDVRVGPAGETLAALADAGETFDLVFVDADKAGYCDYLDAVLDRGLLAPGGMVGVDNTLMQGLPWGAGEPTANGDAIAAFNAAVAADPRVEQVLLPVRDGLTLIRPVADGR